MNSTTKGVIGVARKSSSTNRGNFARPSLKNRRERKRQIERAVREQALPISRLTPAELRMWKERLQPVIDDANNRINALHNRFMTTVELDRFQQGDDKKMFDIFPIRDADELRAYMTNVRVVLNSMGTDDNKAFLETAMLEGEQYRGQFGNQYYEGGRRFNINNVVDDDGNIVRRAIDEETAKRAFAAYRRLEEEYGAVIGRQGQQGVYGSENLIIAIYDMEAKGMDGQVYGHDLLDAWLSEYQNEMEGVKLSFSDAEAIIGVWDDFISRRR